jgi:hypothetical protein
MIKQLLSSVLIINIFINIFGCKPESVKNGTPGNALSINYGDSILYLTNQTGDVIVTPQVMPKPGKFSSFPEGLELNNNTGAINISKSETGMKYKIYFVPDGSTDTVTKRIILSGISYKDFYHIQTANDTLSRPFYNANFTEFNLPCSGGSGCTFDVGGTARAEGLEINTNTGVINLKKSIQNGLFGSGTPSNGSAKELTLHYQLNDNSNKATNEIKLKFYYFNTRNDVDANLSQLVIDRGDMFLRLTGNAFLMEDYFSSRTNASKPRPPCIIILGT